VHHDVAWTIVHAHFSVAPAVPVAGY
jgi:hypothetical protein